MSGNLNFYILVLKKYERLNCWVCHIEKLEQVNGRCRWMWDLPGTKLNIVSHATFWPSSVCKISKHSAWLFHFNCFRCKAHQYGTELFWCLTFSLSIFWDPTCCSSSVAMVLGCLTWGRGLYSGRGGQNLMVAICKLLCPMHWAHIKELQVIKINAKSPYMTCFLIRLWFSHLKTPEFKFFWGEGGGRNFILGQH